MKRLALASVLLLALAGRAGADGIDNLSALSRLLSLVRFFHPSDQAAAADWNRVAVAGVRTVEGAESPEALARSLEGLLRPLAPTLRVVPQGQRPETAPELRPPSGDARIVAWRQSPRIVAWRHYGGHFDAPSKVFSSERIDDRSPAGFGTLAQAIPADPLRGRKVRLRAWVRAEMEGDGKAQLGLRVDRADGQPSFFDNMEGRPIRDPGWRLYEIEGEVARDADRILVMLVVTGSGRVWIDEVSLAPSLANASFDEGETGAHPPGWLFPYESIRAGYHLVLRRGGECRKGGCAEIVGDAIAAPRFRRPEDVLEVDLGAGVVAFLPVSLYAGAQGTPPPGSEVAAAVDPGPDTREARLATVVLAWGILQHLHPWLDPENPDWREGLRPALAAASDLQGEGFLEALGRFLAPLRDARAALFRMDDPEERLLPLAWELIDGRLVVTGVAEGAAGIRAGDVVSSLDGRPVEEILAEAEAAVSAATPESRRRRAFDRRLRGAPGSRVTLGLQGSGEVSVARTVPYDQSVAGTPLPPVAEPRPGVVYVDLGRIQEEELAPLLPRLAAARGLVFDLRHGANVSTVLLSHLAERTVASSRWQVPVVMSPDHREVEWLTTFWTIEPKEPRLRGKAAFLVDGRVDGFGETLLGMVEEYGLGEIVGARSGGSNGSVNWSDLPGGYRLIWTGQRVLKHDGTPLHGVGVAPTVPAARTREGVAAGRDEIVERAVEVVGARP